MGQKLTIVAPHTLESVVRQPPDRWLSNARMTHYQSLLLNRDRIQFAPPVALNPATMLPETDPDDAGIFHSCREVLAEETGIRHDLDDRPLPDADHTWYTDGSSYIVEGKRVAGAAVVDSKSVIWASSLPEGTSAQRAELIALTQALNLAEGKKVNVYTDSRYAFATAHVHGAIYKQRGLLTSAGREIKNKKEILDLLEAVHKPLKVAIIHCPGHQGDGSETALGNQRADREAKKAAHGLNVLTLSSEEGNDGLLPYKSVMQPKDPKTPLSQEEAKAFLKQLHHLTHLEKKTSRDFCPQFPFCFA